MVRLFCNCSDDCIRGILKYVQNNERSTFSEFLRQIPLSEIIESWMKRVSGFNGLVAVLINQWWTVVAFDWIWTMPPSKYSHGCNGNYAAIMIRQKPIDWPIDPSVSNSKRFNCKILKKSSHFKRKRKGGLCRYNDCHLISRPEKGREKLRSTIMSKISGQFYCSNIAF